MPIMVKVSQFSVIIFTYRMLWFFTLSKDGHVSWLFTEPESLKWTVSHRGQLQEKYLYVASLKAAENLRDIELGTANPPTLQGYGVHAALCCSVHHHVLPPSGLQCQGDEEEGGAGHGGRQGVSRRLTGVIRMAGCAPQPCMARCRVSLNMLRSSTAWQYTASIRGHQSSADCKARAA